MSYIPLVVRASLMAPVIFDRPQPLDGIIAAAVIENPVLRERSRHARFWRRLIGDRGRDGARAYFQSKGWPIPANDGHFVPLAVWGHGVISGMWVYASSWAMFEGEHERALVHFNKRLNTLQVLDLMDPSAMPRRVYTGKGEFKNIRLVFEATSVDTLVWHLCGDLDALQDILPLVHSVGKKRRRGYGVVRRWTITPEDTDRSVFDESGNLMRPVPVDLLRAMRVKGEFEVAYTSYRAPYWDPRYATRCAVSGRRTDL